MHTNERQTHGRAPVIGRRGRAMVAAFSMAMVAGTACASMPVIDVANIAQTAMVYATGQDQLQQLIVQHQQLIEAYALQAKQYQQLFINLQNLPNAVPPPGNNFAHLDEAELTEMQCGESGAAAWIGGLVSSLLSQDTPFAESRKKICQQIVVLQVLKYNETADILNRLNGYAKLAQDAEDQRQQIPGDSGSGDLAGNSNQVQRNAAQLGVEMDSWKGRMGAYDAQLQALRDAQAMLAQAALRGHSPDLLGTSVQALALKAALELNP